MTEHCSLEKAQDDTAMLSRWNFDHETTIQAPVQLVWEYLADISSWGWNPCVRLRAEAVQAGMTGRVSMATQKKRWQVHEFVFDRVDRRRFIFSWTTLVGKCKITNAIKLSPAGMKTTRLTHTLKLTDVFPGLRWKVPLKSIVYYPICINEALKNHVESVHFNQLLVTLSSSRDMTPSSRDMTVGTETSTSMELCDTSMTASYWESPPEIRNQIVDSFLSKRIRFAVDEVSTAKTL